MTTITVQPVNLKIKNKSVPKELTEENDKGNQVK